MARNTHSTLSYICLQCLLSTAQPLVSLLIECKCCSWIWLSSEDNSTARPLLPFCLYLSSAFVAFNTLRYLWYQLAGHDCQKHCQVSQLAMWIPVTSDFVPRGT